MAWAEGCVRAHCLQVGGAGWGPGGVLSRRAGHTESVCWVGVGNSAFLIAGFGGDTRGGRRLRTGSVVE
eukprot:15239918-Alexandrium_andersonii.AAC.1